MSGRARLVRGIELAAAVAGLILFVVWLASDEARDAVADAACLLYPGGVIALLVLAVLGLIAALVRERRRGRRPAAVPPQPERDRRLIAEMIEVLPRQAITFLRQHDFGGPWEDEDLRPFSRLAHERDEVEHTLTDPELEAIRVELMSAVKTFLTETAMRGGVDRHGCYSLRAWDHIPHSGGEEGREERFQESRQVINEAADEVVTCYDGLLTEARNKDVLG